MNDSPICAKFEHVFAAIQDSLFDDSVSNLERTQLTSGAWVDHQPGWLSNSMSLFTDLAESIPWRAERRAMYDRVVQVPRLTCFIGESEPLPHPRLVEIRKRLNERYEPELGEPLTTAGLCFYRDHQDSVAWHGDTIGRGKAEDTVVAIVSLGAARPLLLRPKGGGHAIRFNVGHGDLLVMGGSCQRTWEHAVPKVAHSTGPRISVQFRPTGVR